MAQMVTVKCFADPAGHMGILKDSLSKMSDDAQDRFVIEWRAMERAGAVAIETITHEDPLRIYAVLSDDFLRHMRAHGMPV